LKQVYYLVIAKKIVEMQIKGEMLKLLENLKVRQGEVYLAAEEAELELQEAKDAVAAKIKEMHDTVDSYNKKIRYAIDNWDRLQGDQPQKQGGGIATFLAKSTTKEDIPAGDWEAAQAWQDWHEWAEVTAKAASTDNPQ
jgi:hypothetical protein